MQFYNVRRIYGIIKHMILSYIILNLKNNLIYLLILAHNILNLKLNNYILSIICFMSTIQNFIFII